MTLARTLQNTVGCVAFDNGLGGIRTPDLMVRSHALYPTKLQALIVFTVGLRVEISD